MCSTKTQHGNNSYGIDTEYKYLGKGGGWSGVGTEVRRKTEAPKAEADVTWDGQTRRGQARRARVILFGLDPFVVMVDGAAGGTYRENGASTVLSMTGGGGSRIGNGSQRKKRINQNLDGLPLESISA